MVVYDRLVLECGIEIKKGESFPLDSDEKLNECRTSMVARVDWPGRPGEPEGDVAVYEYRDTSGKTHYIATNYNMTVEIVGAISDDPHEAVGYAALEMLDWSLKHGYADDVAKILKTYAKLAEDLDNN